MAPVQLSEPPLTVQLATSATFQYTRVLSPLRMSEGETCRWPVSPPEPGVNDGGGGAMQAPPPHWYEQDCTTAPVQLLITFRPEQEYVGVHETLTSAESGASPRGPEQETV